MMKLAGLGRLAVAAVVLSGVSLGSSAGAQEVSEEQLKAARAAIDSLGVTNQFDNILPNLAERLKGSMIQASPNYGEQISSAVDQQALSLASRRADLERESATIYAKTFTVDELKAIAAFYGSPAGQKLLKDGPIASRELIKAANIWSAGISRDLAAQSNKALSAVIKEPLPSIGDDLATPGSVTPAPTPQQ
ncbi:DUF2059 domain-containing protein [Rhizobium sp. BK251]|uniref:DUF2059 domain-containing protein n=1 Tax=Rhizobium sp. BK251 TaxID=2512125 RepID=UPI0010536888|nr:DUF2059 domain-containing protein [Rhizobium sp. BK251]TCL73485.1 hypothetical protein EV286_10313 [Rhizobium sp. BK251]